MKLKGQSVKVGKKQYVLRDQLGQGGFSTIYETNQPEIICKAQVLVSPQIQEAYRKEKEMLRFLSHPNIVKLYDATQITIKDVSYGLLFMQKCSKGTAFDVLQKSEGTNLNEKTIVGIALIVAQVLKHMHQNGVTHRDIKMENILISTAGQYKLCDFGSCERNMAIIVDANNRVQVQDRIEKTTTPLYRSPEQLDLYSGFVIGPKVDIFALGVFIFMMCFQKPPFQSRLSAINKQYFLPDTHSYSKEMLLFIEKCFVIDPSHRMDASEACQELARIRDLRRLQIRLPIGDQLQLSLQQLSHISQNNLQGSAEIAQSGFFDKVRRIYNQMTTQTQGWILGFVEDSEQAPIMQYNRSIISKCYQKRYKVDKVYDIISKYSDQFRDKCLVTLKLLVLLHDFLRKGPPQAILHQKQNSPLNLCTKIYSHWKTAMRPTDPEDIKRNSFVCLVIRCYTLIIISKIKLCFQNADLIQANYSIVPYLTHINSRTILKLSFIQQMISYLDLCTQFHQQLLRINYVSSITKTIILSLIDEQYCLVSTLTFLLAAYKQAVCFSNQKQIDFKGLQARIAEVESDFEQTYQCLAKLFIKTQQKNILNQNNISLSGQVITYIKGIKLQRKEGKFIITDHLNYKNSIFGLKIPLTYEEVVKNPNFLKDINKMALQHQQMVQLNEFKTKQSSNKSSPNNTKSQSQGQNEKKLKQSAPNQMPKQNTKNQGNLQVQKKVSGQSPPSQFAKPKDNKDKVFDNFDFKIEKKIHENKAPTVEFSHQNLNKDFMSIDLVGISEQKKGDQFRDFFSIVEEKYEKEKDKKGQKSQPQLNVVSNATSKQVFASETPNDIAKIELMNFFFDDQDPSRQPVAKTETSLIKFEQSIKSQPKMQVKTQISSKHGNLINIEQQAQGSSVRKSGREKQKERRERKEGDLIDLRDFVVEQVKRNAQQYIIDFGALIFKEKIGYGNSSEVFKGQWRGREVAIKKIKDNMNSQRASKEFRREIMTSVRIRYHPQLVTLIGVSQHQQYFYIINQFCKGSTLFDLLHESSAQLPWTTRILIAKQIAQGMIFLHTNDPPIIHRDLKSLNALLVNEFDPKNPNGVSIKIADFGLSRDYASTYMTGTLGTYHWMAPQIFNNEPYTLKADVYSYGIVLWQIASRVPPYTNMNNPHSLMKFVTMENGRPDMNFVDKNCPLQLRMLMVRCWDKFPSNRPTFQEILNCLQYLER